MILNETPITILQKNVKFLDDFIRVIETKEGLNPEASEEKLNNIKQQCTDKIREFESAITTLTAIAKWRKKFAEERELFEMLKEIFVNESLFKREAITQSRCGCGLLLTEMHKCITCGFKPKEKVNEV